MNNVTCFFISHVVGADLPLGGDEAVWLVPDAHPVRLLFTVWLNRDNIKRRRPHKKVRKV